MDVLSSRCGRVVEHPSVPCVTFKCRAHSLQQSHPYHFARSTTAGRAPAAALTDFGIEGDRETCGESPVGDLASTSVSSAQGRMGVLLLNLGGPETLDDVQPFLYNLFADPDIIRLPGPLQFLQPAIAQLVSSLRAPKSREGYEAIGGGSPLRKITEDQAVALEESLERKGLHARTYVAMRYWKPFTGVDRVGFAVFPLIRLVGWLTSYAQLKSPQIFSHGRGCYRKGEARWDYPPCCVAAIPSILGVYQWI